MTILVSFETVWKYLTLTGTFWALSNQEMIGAMKKRMIAIIFFKKQRSGNWILPF